MRVLYIPFCTNIKQDRGAMTFMLEEPDLIKAPVLRNKKFYCFSPTTYLCNMYIVYTIRYVCAGFSTGSVYWDDENFFNHDSTTGVLPDGVYGSNTLIYYCCR